MSEFTSKMKYIFGITFLLTYLFFKKDTKVSSIYKCKLWSLFSKKNMLKKITIDSKWYSWISCSPGLNYSILKILVPSDDTFCFLWLNVQPLILHSQCELYQHNVLLLKHEFLWSGFLHKVHKYQVHGIEVSWIWYVFDKAKAVLPKFLHKF